ncbi:MAG: MoaD/ThiS family protein [Anaerolineales bacterium]|nr:MoaD/ThiS family protein [Anaerolineales bacterium]
MISVKVLFLSSIRSTIGQKEVEVELAAGSTVRDLKKTITGMYPHAGTAIDSMLTSVNQIFSDDDTCLADQAEIAFFPHITGG